MLNLATVFHHPFLSLAAQALCLVFVHRLTPDFYPPVLDE